LTQADIDGTEIPQRSSRWGLTDQNPLASYSTHEWREAILEPKQRSWVAPSLPISLSSAQ
jgi:hypothetical protein